MVRSKLLLMIYILIIISVQNNYSATVTDSFDNGPYTYLYSGNLTSIQIDGELTPGEYPSTITLLDNGDNYVSELSWMHNSTHLAIYLHSKGTGWVAIGLGEKGVSMAGADIIMAAMVDNTLHIQDMHSESQDSPDPDELSSISIAAGKQGEDWTSVEFILPMQSDDDEGNDFNWIVDREYGFFTAFHNNQDDFSDTHTAHSQRHTVQVLDATVPYPGTVSLQILANETVDGVQFEIEANSDTINCSGLKIGIYEKSYFGRALLEVVILDISGTGLLDLELIKDGEIEFVAILPASLQYTRAEASIAIDFESMVDSEAKSFGDLRDIYGEHMIRNLLLSLLVVSILLVLFKYYKTINDLRIIRGKTINEEVGQVRRKVLKYIGIASLGITLLNFRAVGDRMMRTVDEIDRPYQQWQIEDSEWVMVIDLNACDGCKDTDRPRCTQACINGHYTPDTHEYIKVFEIIDDFSGEPYFFPRPCQQCRDPPCVDVCPVEAAWQRDGDRLTLIDTNRCIGCRLCMAACPYDVRFFHWEENPKGNSIPVDALYSQMPFSLVQDKGVVSKCEFCGLQFMGLLPHCVSACDEGAIYFGNLKENMVTNSDGKTVMLNDFLKIRGAYRWKEELGTDTRVYYLPKQEGSS
ncbi:MAG: 4Fe-4S dicluster domain-containing protein [Candidatus Heimdallarchaeota archaeon]|nr:4Fe-4S dicluster domain-containing protein [Candidatus Heimdallarchaeota archaeon]